MTIFQQTFAANLTIAIPLNEGVGAADAREQNIDVLDGLIDTDNLTGTLRCYKHLVDDGRLPLVTLFNRIHIDFCRPSRCKVSKELSRIRLVAIAKSLGDQVDTARFDPMFDHNPLSLTPSS